MVCAKRDVCINYVEYGKSIIHKYFCTCHSSVFYALTLHVTMKCGFKYLDMHFMLNKNTFYFITYLFCCLINYGVNMRIPHNKIKPGMVLID